MIHRHTRRGFLAAAGGLVAWSFAPRAVSAAGTDPENRRLLVIVLRGGLDGLAIVPVPGDPAWGAVRGVGVRDASMIRLDDTFALNARMANLAALYRAGEALVIHAVATPYRSRSHFEAQDVLETGYPGVVTASGSTGWLNRALAVLPRGARLPRPSGLALTPTVPLLMRGPAPVDTWQPQLLPMVDADTIGRLLSNYEVQDPVLAEAMRRGAALDADLGMGARAGGTAAEAALREMTRTAARMMARPDGPRVAMMNMSGWDTHISQGFAQGPVAARAAALDGIVGGLREGMEEAWRSAAVLIVTEFGRTVRLNGSAGTDHGTGTSAFLLGGAVRGGRVLADWPGLAEGQLLDRRDLRPTTDLRSVIKGVLSDHLGLEEARLSKEVFPESAGVRAAGGLIRAG